MMCQLAVALNTILIVNILKFTLVPTPAAFLIPIPTDFTSSLIFILNQALIFRYLWIKVADDV